MASSNICSCVELGHRRDDKDNLIEKSLGFCLVLFWLSHQIDTVECVQCQQRSRYFERSFPCLLSLSCAPTSILRKLLDFSWVSRLVSGPRWRLAYLCSFSGNEEKVSTSFAFQSSVAKAEGLGLCLLTPSKPNTSSSRSGQGR